MPRFLEDSRSLGHKIGLYKWRPGLQLLQAIPARWISIILSAISLTSPSSSDLWIAMLGRQRIWPVSKTPICILGVRLPSLHIQTDPKYRVHQRCRPLLLHSYWLTTSFLAAIRYRGHRGRDSGVGLNHFSPRRSPPLPYP